MSIDERIVQNLAANLSRRNFLKTLGLLVTGLGAIMVGKVETAQAGPACCPDPECSGCQLGGSECPSGYTKYGVTRCCLDGCWWTCSKCQANWPPYDICYCSHEDLTLCGPHCTTRSGLVIKR